MRALELLYQYKQADEIAGGYLSKPIDEAIKEIEDLQNENKSLVKTLEMYNQEMINLRIKNQELIQFLIDTQKLIETNLKDK